MKIPLLLAAMVLTQLSGCKKDEYIIQTGILTDIDGNVYKSVKIGSQWWMAENLKTTKYNDGTYIPNVTDDTTWQGLTSGAYCWYDNNIENKNDYGALYNWHTINAGNLSPTGWHVPSREEWNILITHLGGSAVASGKLREIGTTHWQSPNTGATNKSGFTALPGGYRHYSGVFVNFGEFGQFWSASETNPGQAWSTYMVFNTTFLYIDENFSQTWGFSVRCVKD